MRGHVTLCYMVVGGNLKSPLNLFISFAKALMEQGFPPDPFLAKDGSGCQIRNEFLILRTGNSARSQMAEGLLQHDAGDRFEVFSAGTRPSHVRPEAIAVMRELGIDISDHRSKSIDEFADQSFD